ncbi:hypothetical protein [Nocardia noduli]|uniref:hypothetical protein n=1 Tax=Nocardia noduli TaxID=2815722 RepID=UPI0020B2767E|nr:hypothetical protein [Nocardia noduli]
MLLTTVVVSGAVGVSEQPVSATARPTIAIATRRRVADPTVVAGGSVARGEIVSARRSRLVISVASIPSWLPFPTISVHGRVRATLSTVSAITPPGATAEVSDRRGVAG